MMRTFHIPINLDLNRRGHKPLQKGKKPNLLPLGSTLAPSFQSVFRGDNVIPRVDSIDKTQRSLAKSFKIRSLFGNPDISPLQSLFSEFSGS